MSTTATTTTPTPATALPTGTWTADPVHSEVGFNLEYLAGTFRGTFSTFSVEIADGRLAGTAEAASVQVKDPNLEAHLQSPEFFDAERHPQLRFASHEVGRSENTLTIDGELTIKGETRPIELVGTIGDTITDPYGNERFGLKLEGEIDRAQFGVSWNTPLPSGEPALSDRVQLVADLQLVKAG